MDDKNYGRIWVPQAERQVKAMRAAGVPEKDIEQFCWNTATPYVAPIVVEDKLGEQAAKFAAGLN